MRKCSARLLVEYDNDRNNDIVRELSLFEMICVKIEVDVGIYQECMVEMKRRAR